MKINDVRCIFTVKILLLPIDYLHGEFKIKLQTVDNQKLRKRDRYGKGLTNTSLLLDTIEKPKKKTAGMSRFDLSGSVSDKHFSKFPAKSTVQATNFRLIHRYDRFNEILKSPRGTGKIYPGYYPDILQSYE